MINHCALSLSRTKPSSRCDTPTTRAFVVFGYLSIATFTASCGAPNSHAGEAEIVLQGASNWIYRGTTETGNNPAIGIAVDWQVSDRSFVGFEAHQAEVDGVSQRHRSFLVYAGTGLALNERWYASGVVSHREFPGSGREWDFTEFKAQLDHTAGWTLSVDFSPDYYEHNTRSVAAEVGFRRDVTKRVYAYASVGAIEFSESQFPDYRYGSIGAGIRIGQVVLDLGYHANSEGNDSTFGVAAFSNPRLIGQLSWRVR